MSTTVVPSRVVPERYRWAILVLLGFAVLYGLVAVVTLVGQVGHLVAWMQPDARVPLEFGTSYALPLDRGTHEYSGSAFVRDGTAIIATRVSTTLDGIPLGNRIALGAAPLLWTSTALVVTLLLALVLRRLFAGAAFGRDAARPVVLAALALAVGSTLAQVVEGASAIAFGAIAWPAPEGADPLLSRTDGFTFSFVPLLVACGLLVVALVLRRGLALQRDVDGLV